MHEVQLRDAKARLSALVEADQLEVSLNGGPRLFVPYGSERADHHRPNPDCGRHGGLLDGGSMGDRECGGTWHAGR